MTMKRFLTVMIVILAACAPSAKYSLTPVAGINALDFAAEFQPALKQLGIQLKEGTVQRYQSQGEPLLEITQAFYQTYPGFCPLRVDGFQRSQTRAKFVTITAQGRDVKLFAYEPEQQGVLYAVVSGVSRDVLAVGACPK